MPGALDGIRVLDLCSHLSGPYCAMMLGDLGADVIKVERPGEGDDARHMPPFVHGALGLYEAAHVFATGKNPVRLGQAHRSNAPNQVFQTQDRWITIGGAQENLWKRLCTITNLPDLPNDPRFTTIASRVENNKALIDLLQSRLTLHPSAHWLAEFEAAGIPAGPVLTHTEVFQDPQILAREMVVDLDHPKAGRTKTLGVTIRMSATPATIRRPATLRATGN